MRSRSKEKRKIDLSKSEIEHCVVCKAPTPFKKKDPIKIRTGYVEGGGQLCNSCEKELYV